MPGTTQPTALLLYALLAVVGLIILIARFRLNAFVALTLASVFVGLCSGMRLSRIAEAFQEGVGSMLGSVALIVGLGMILGKLLAESGAARVIAVTLVQALGERRLPWTLMLAGFIVGLPVFFTVGVVLLVPILLTIVRETRQPLLSLAIPMLAGLSVAHGLIPPHPGPMAAIGITHADVGRTLLYALLVGLPTAAVAGPLLGRRIGARVPVSSGLQAKQHASPQASLSSPGFFLAISTVLLPVLLMLASTVADLMLTKGNQTRLWLDFLGHPMIAMLVTALFALYTLGAAQGFGRQQLLQFTEECLVPAGSILLVVGAGGGFNRVLVASGVGDAIAALARSAQLSPLLLGWLVAALIRVATGSATVAITTAAGIVAPFAASVPGTNLELLVIAMGAGSLVLSHVNDGGFWFVKEYLGLSVPETLRSWTILETVIGVVALVFVLLLNLVC